MHHKIPKEILHRLLVRAQASPTASSSFSPKIFHATLEFTDPTSTLPDVKNAWKGLIGLIITCVVGPEREGGQEDMRDTGRPGGGLVPGCRRGATDWEEEGGGGARRRHTGRNCEAGALLLTVTHNTQYKTQHNHITHNKTQYTTHTCTTKTQQTTKTGSWVGASRGLHTGRSFRSRRASAHSLLNHSPL